MENHSFIGLFKKIFQVSSIKFLAALSSFILTYILINQGSAEVLGSFAFALITVQFVSAMSSCGIDSVLLRLALKRHSMFINSIRYITHEALSVGIITSSIGAGLTFLTGYFLRIFRSDLEISCRNLMIMSPIVIFSVIMKISSSHLRGKYKIGLSQIIDHSFPPFMTTLVVSFSSRELINTSGYIAYIYLFSSMISAILGLYLIEFSYNLVRSNIIRNIKLKNVRMIKIGAKVQIANLTNYGADWITTGSLALFLPISSVAIFRIVNQFTQAFSLAMSSVEIPTANLIGKLFHQRRFRDTRKFISNMQISLATLSVIPISLLFVYADFIMENLFHLHHSYAPLCLRIILIGQIVSIITGPVGSALVLFNQGNLLVRSSVSSLIVVIISMGIFMPIFGLVGACMASALNIITRNFLNFYWVIKTIDRAATSASRFYSA